MLERNPKRVHILCKTLKTSIYCKTDDVVHVRYTRMITINVYFEVMQKSFRICVRGVGKC